MTSREEIPRQLARDLDRPRDEPATGTEAVPRFQTRQTVDRRRARRYVVVGFGGSPCRQPACEHGPMFATSHRGRRARWDSARGPHGIEGKSRSARLDGVFGPRCCRSRENGSSESSWAPSPDLPDADWLPRGISHTPGRDGRCSRRPARRSRGRFRRIRPSRRIPLRRSGATRPGVCRARPDARIAFLRSNRLAAPVSPARMRAPWASRHPHRSIDVEPTAAASYRKPVPARHTIMMADVKHRIRTFPVTALATSMIGLPCHGGGEVGRFLSRGHV